MNTFHDMFMINGSKHVISDLGFLFKPVQLTLTLIVVTTAIIDLYRRESIFTLRFLLGLGVALHRFRGHFTIHTSVCGAIFSPSFSVLSLEQ